MVTEIDTYALVILCFVFFVLGGLVGLLLGAWSQKEKVKKEEELKKKYEEEHKKEPPPPQA